MLAEAGNFPDLAQFYMREVIGRARRLIIGILRRGHDARRVPPTGPSTPRSFR